MRTTSAPWSVATCMLATCAAVVAAFHSVAVRGADRVEGGNGQYRVVIDDDRDGVFHAFAGFYTVYTGPEHPATAFLGRPGEILALGRDCVACGGISPFSFSSVRSWSSHSDYTLGTQPSWGMDYFRVPEPGFDCSNADDLTRPEIESIVLDGEAVGVRATWDIVRTPDDLRIEEVLRAHGDDFMGSAAEVTVTVSNFAAIPIRIGIRDVWVMRTSKPLTPSDPWEGTALSAFVGIRPPDPPEEPFTLTETEWFSPTFRAWETYLTPRPSTDPRYWYYSSGAVGGPTTLEPLPTAPDLVQQGAANLLVTDELPGGGTMDSCFEWRIPDMPRRVFDMNQMSMTSYWGYPEERAIELGPGESVSVTQYLLAYVDYPLAVDAGGPYEEPCAGATTSVALTPTVTMAEPTTAEVRYRWSSPDPSVTFADPTVSETEALVSGGGSHPVSFTVSVGPYEATGQGTVTVVDADGPRFTRLEATPSALWPPDHRMVDVNVTLEVEDDCDPSPAVRLVSVTSDEAELAPGQGSGHSRPDVLGAELGTDDRHLRLRAERGGRLDGRTYELTYEAEDAAGHVTMARVQVVVPHDRRPESGLRPPDRPPVLPRRR